MVLKSIGIVSAGKLLGCMYGLLGLLIGAMFTLVSLLGLAVGGAERGLAPLLFGIGAIIMMPIFYGLVGFVGGILMAALYNVIASFVGGIEMDLQPPAGPDVPSM